MHSLTDSLIAARALTRNWRLASAIAFTMALAVAATATTLTAVNVVLLRPLPFPRPEQLHRVLSFNDLGESTWVSLSALSDWQAGVRDAQLAGYTISDFSVTGDGPPQSILATRVTAEFFDTLGIAPFLGQRFTSSKYRSGSDHVIGEDSDPTRHQGICHGANDGSLDFQRITTRRTTVTPQKCSMVGRTDPTRARRRD